MNYTLDEDPLQISLTEGMSPIPSQATATKRAAKADFGLGDASPGVEKLSAAIMQGNEGDLRQQVATEELLRNRQLKESMIENIARSGAKLPPQALGIVRDMTTQELTSEDPGTIFEKKFAERYVQAAQSVNGVGLRAMAENEDAAHNEMDIFANVIEYNQAVQTRLENLSSEWEKMGWFDKATNVGGQLVPLLSAARMASLNNIPGIAILPGNNLEEKIQGLYFLPKEERLKKLDEAIDQLKGNNILDAITFTQAILKYSQSDKYLNNFVGITDVAGVGSLAVKGVVKAVRGQKAAKAAQAVEDIPDFLGHTGPAKPAPFEGKITVDGETINWSSLEEMRRALKDAAKSVSKPENDIQDVVTDIGDADLGGTIHSLNKLRSVFLGEGGYQLQKDLVSFINPQKFLSEGSNLSREFGNRIVEDIAARRDALANRLTGFHVPRLTEEALQQGIAETKNSLLRDYSPRVNDGIVDLRHVPAEETLQNNDSVVLKVGRPNALPFQSVDEAKYYFEDHYGFSPGEARIVNQGASYYIEIERPLDEITDGVRNAMVTPKKNQTPIGMFTGLMGRLRSAEDLLSEFQRGTRKIATHAPQKLTKALQDAVEETASKLSRTERKNVEQLLIRNRDEKNQATGERGLWYNDIASFEQAYQRQFGTLPSADEAAHYFNYRTVSDFEFLIRNLALYRDKARLGVRQWSWKVKDGEDITQVPFFEGKHIDGPPWTGRQNAGIWVYDTKTGKGDLVFSHDIINGTSKTLTKRQIDDMVNHQGFKTVQVFDPKKRPLRDVAKINGQPVEDQIHFVVTNGFDEQALSWSQLTYRPGGHSIYRDSWYVKQPVMVTGLGGKTYYYGDNAVMNFSTEAAAKKYAAAMEQARGMLRTNNPNLNAFLARNLPYSRADFEQMFNSGHLNIENPIAYTHEARDTITTNPWLRKHFGDYVDGTRSEYDLSGMIDRSFTADRDDILNTVKESGGVYQIGPSRQLDPYTAMNRALGQSVRNLWMADYKVQAVETWIREFADLMEPTSLKTMYQRPLHFLYRPQWRNTEGLAKDQLNAAQASQRAIVNLLRTKSELGDQIYHIQNKLASSIYNVGGQKAADVVSDVADWPLIRDPVQFVRSVAFHSKLGMFNPVQLFVQAQSLTHATAILGIRRGTESMAAAWFARRSLHTDDAAIIDKFADMSTKWGWKREEFKEMRDILLNKSGIAEVAGEAILRDDVFDPQIYKSGIGYWLDKGTMFFNEGERIVRLTAFAGAYKEWRAANPTLKIGNREIADIMRRSDDLSVNMTRASAASWQTGVLSIPTQFMAYNVRLMEQIMPFMGKRLTSAEKARAFATYSTLYGVPAGLSAATGVWPWYDDIKEEALKRGIDLSPKYMQVIMEGAISTMISTATGHDYNVAQRYGPGGNTLFRDILRGDKGVLEIVGGASGSIIGDIWESTDPVRRYIAASTFGSDEVFPVKGKDFLPVLNNLSTANLLTKVYGIMQYGKIITQRGTEIGPADTMDAVMAMLGLTPQHIADTYLRVNAGKEDKKAQEWFETKAMEQFALALHSAANNDQKSWGEYMNRYRSYIRLGNFNFQDQDRIWRRVSEYKPDLMDKVNWDFVRRSPDSQFTSRFQTFIKNRDNLKRQYQ